MKASDSLKQRLADERKRLVVDMPVTTGDGDELLVVRYQALPRERITELHDRHGGRGDEFNLKLVVEACQALLVRDGDGRLVGLNDDAADQAYVDDDNRLQGTPVTYASDWTLSTLGVDTARDAALMLHPREGAIDMEAGEVTRLSGYEDGGERGNRSRGRR